MYVKDKKYISKYPQKVSIKNVDDFILGDLLTVVLDDSGNVFTMGENI